MIYTLKYCDMEEQEELDFQEKYKEALKDEWYNTTYLPRGFSYSATLHHAKLQPDDVVLDIGCGCSYFVTYIADMVKKVYGIDNYTSLSVVQEWIKTIFDFDVVKSGKVAVLREEAARLPFRDEMFDKVFSFSVFEHFDWERGDDVSCAKEIYRVLKPGGIFTGTVDYNPITEHPQCNPGAKTYTYESFMGKVVESGGFDLAGEIKLDPIPEVADYIVDLFFKLVKS